jgi:methionine aminopeptidase
VNTIMISGSVLSISSVNEAICHGIPDHRKLKEGDIINLGEQVAIFYFSNLIQHPDVSLYHDGLEVSLNSLHRLITLSGHHGDLNGTYAVGKIDEDSIRLVNTTRQCLDEAIKICRPGALFRDIGKVMYVVDIHGVWGSCVIFPLLVNLSPVQTDVLLCEHIQGME